MLRTWVCICINPPLAVVQPAGILGRDTRHVLADIEYPKGGPLEKASQGGYDMTSRYGGIVLLEEKIVSSQLDWQDMWVKDFIHIGLVCK